MRTAIIEGKFTLVEARPAPFFGDQEVVVAEEELALVPVEGHLSAIAPEEYGFVAQGPRDDPEYLAACTRSMIRLEEQKAVRLAEIVEEARRAQAREDEGREALAARRNRAQIRHQELQPTAAPTCQASRGNTITGGRTWDEMSRWERSSIGSALNRALYG